MAKRAICDNEGCERQQDLDSAYETIPSGWYSLRLPDRVTSRDLCSLACLEAIVRATRVTADAQAASMAETVASIVAEDVRRVSDAPGD